MSDPRFSRSAGCEVFTGNELILKGGLESGMALLTGYPGSPVSEIFDTAFANRGLLLKHGVLAQMANNEALAAARLNGARMANLRAIAVFKSVGMHVAADALAIGNLTEPNRTEGGALVVVGDDPWNDTTQIHSDSRYLAQHLWMPILHPSTFQEIKDWIKVGFELSGATNLYLAMILATNQADGGGGVQVFENSYPKINLSSKTELSSANCSISDFVMIPPHTSQKESTMRNRYEKFLNLVREKGLNSILYTSNLSPNSPLGKGVDPDNCRETGYVRAPLGFISSGIAYAYLEHALYELGLSGKFPILKLGCIYPLDAELIKKFLQQVEMAIVVEEKRAFIEDQIKTILQEFNQENGRPSLVADTLAPTQSRASVSGLGASRTNIQTSVWGKKFPNGLSGIPEVRGLNTSILIEHIGSLLLKFPELLPSPQSSPFQGEELLLLEKGEWSHEEVRPRHERPREGERAGSAGEAGMRIQQELALIRQTAETKILVPVRTPTFCPGCPHRDSAAVSIKIKNNFLNGSPPLVADTSVPTQSWISMSGREGGREPEDLLFHGESGCHSMLQFAPYEGLMQNYSGMGLGGGTGAGIDPFIKNKQVVFLGDSTFFHSGMIAVSDSIKNNQNILYVILDNKTTAMTGHQPTPGNDFDILGRATFQQKIENVIRGFAGGEKIPIVRADPGNRENYTALLEELVLKPGVKIVIADKECAITYQRRLKKEKKQLLKKQGFLPKEEFINITPEVCEYCLECTRSTGCPGLTIEDTDFGPKIVTDLSSCVSDGACAKGKVCPSFEKVTIRRKNPPAKREKIDGGTIPLPQMRSFGEHYYISTFAVGGMGAGVVSAILVRAGLAEGYQVHFLDKKGLAIRNGGVYGHILYSKKKEQVFAPLIPYGKANLILGIDILETARGLDPNSNMRVASRKYTHCIVNTHKTPTILTLLGKENFSCAELEKALRNHTNSSDFFSFDFSEISQHFFGSKLYANLLLIGTAYQRGLLPLSLENLTRSIQESISPQDWEENLQAFHLGRKIALEPEKMQSLVSKKNSSYLDVLKEKAEILSRRKFSGKKQAKKYVQLVENATRWLHLDAETNKKIALRVYELIQYENVELAEQYLSLLWDIYRKDRQDLNFLATRAVIENLFKVLAIKDEIYVSHLLTSTEKLERDRERYRVNPENGDTISYVHLNRPAFSFWGLELEWDMQTRNWMLHIMKYCKFLRRLLPEWHHREKEFRDWYIELVRKFNYFQEDAIYFKYLEILKSPESVNGYRKIRIPKMEAARRRVDALLSQIESSDAAPVGIEGLEV